MIRTLRLKTGLYGLESHDGKTIIPYEYQDVLKGLSEGLYCVKKNNRWGYVNAKNEIVIPFIFIDAEHFKLGIAKVNHNGRDALIDKKGTIFYEKHRSSVDIIEHIFYDCNDYEKFYEHEMLFRFSFYENNIWVINGVYSTFNDWFDFFSKDLSIRTFESRFCGFLSSDGEMTNDIVKKIKDHFFSICECYGLQRN